MRSNSGKTTSFGHGRAGRAELIGAALRSADAGRRSARPSRAALVAALRSRGAGPPSSRPQQECAFPGTWDFILFLKFVRDLKNGMKLFERDEVNCGKFL
ncbi:hypothetical protein Y032_0047g1530 [Ancylostoma ceylanicum]|uniref:Uncharacterized protein n=1 Tax=Ancylostoma ceylanicum TaxID=53326 RepID=A0A016UBM1_9BILA|nr:hypothetical protein Y032_0047g1530 [Ancylostoma ceylanicum]